MKIPGGVNSQIKQRIFAALLVVSGVTLLLSLPAPNSARALQSGTQQLMYVVETRKTATFEVGRFWDINIVLLNKDGHRVTAGSDRRLTITATTLQNFDKVKEVLSEKARRQSKSKSGYDDNKLVLARGQKVAQITIKHGHNEDEKDVHVLSRQAGLLYIFAESEGIATGNTVVVIGEARPAKAMASSSSEGSQGYLPLLPIAWQSGDARRLRLEFNPSTSRPMTATLNGEQLARFRVMLKSATTGQYIRAPEGVKVVLEVLGCCARFDPDLPLDIEKDKMFTLDQATLKTISGGPISVRAFAASTQGFEIEPDERTFDFRPGPHTTDLSVRLQRQSAVANGLDGLELTAMALEDGRIMLPEDEGMEERIITFRLIGDASGVRFENDQSDVRIPKGQQYGKIKLFSTRPVSDLKVVAETFNGLKGPVNTEANATPIQFSFPWFQLLCATIGGGVFPLLRKQSKIMLAQGLILGAVFFGLALFGAIASSPQNLGTVSLILAKLPTENFFASFILGLVGSVLIGVVFKRQLGTGGDRLPAETRSIDTTLAQAQSKRVSDSNDQEKSAPPLKRQDDFVD